MHDIVTFIINTVWDWGYFGIFIMMMIESSFFPFPSEVAMIPAWFLSASGEMDFIIAFVVGTLWAMTGASMNYILWEHLWAKVIKKLIKKYGKYIFISKKHYSQAEKYFEKHWPVTTFIARFIPAIRQLISIPAGVFKMNFRKFLLYTWVGAGSWNLILMTIGYIAGENRELIKQYSTTALVFAIFFVILVGIIYYFIDKKFSKKI